MSAPTLAESAALCRLLADPTRLRLLILLESEELTVAELTTITQLAQSRISTHLGKLREAGLVQDRRQGTSVYYGQAVAAAAPAIRGLWTTLREHIDPDEIERDRENVREVLRQRAPSQTWAESVAGQMELHYSPGRTWEATAHALTPLVNCGEVLDIAAGDGVFARLLSRQARQLTCVDSSAAVAAAGARRLQDQPHARYVRGDMHALPFAEASFDQAFLLNALTFTTAPEAVLAEAARVLRPGGQLVVSTLDRHEHAASVAAYDHRNRGFSPDELATMLERAGLTVNQSQVALVEQRPPYFRVVLADAQRHG